MLHGFWQRKDKVMPKHLDIFCASSAVIVIIPGLLMIGYWQGGQFWQTLLVSACGGCMGVLFTIPLRRAMVVHSDLPYPEGIAAAEILKVGSGQAGSQSVGGGLKEILSGSFVSGLVALCTNGFQVLSGECHFWFSVGRSVWQLPFGFSTALMGAGYYGSADRGDDCIFVVWRH